MLEAIRHNCQERGGDLFLMKVQNPVHAVMESTGFFAHMGQNNILTDEEAITHLFHKVLDPAICIYECSVRVFAECQNLPKRTYSLEIPPYTDIALETIAGIPALELWRELQRNGDGPKVVDVREPRKLPYKTASFTYDLEYGTDTLEVHIDAIKKGKNVLLVDDLLATGGTMNAACSLIEKVGGTICGISFLIELKDLQGREKLGHHKISTVITY